MSSRILVRPKCECACGWGSALNATGKVNRPLADEEGASRHPPYSCQNGGYSSNFLTLLKPNTVVMLARRLGMLCQST